jgi:hypothetical protein
MMQAMRTLPLRTTFGGALIACAALVACNRLFGEAHDDGNPGSDASTDGGGDGDAGILMPSPDASDASDASDSSDAALDVPALVNYPLEVAKTLCAHLQTTCCGATNQAWNTARCLHYFNTGAGFDDIATFEAFLGQGNIVYDQAAAARCLADIATYPCGALPASQARAIRNECLDALRGTLGLDAGCVSSIQCGPNTYCKLPGPDASTGNCVPTLGVGGDCDQQGDEVCNYLLHLGNPQLWCDYTQPTGVCAAQVGLDAGCYNNLTCVSGACGLPNYVCVDTEVVFGSWACEMFSTIDAGDGGG